MSYKDFERGISGTGLQKWKQREANELLRQEMMSLWHESERILGILRSTGSVALQAENIETWFNGVKDYPRHHTTLEQVPSSRPSDWFRSKFPEVTDRFGRAFFEETVLELEGRTMIRASVINEDFFAAMLGGEKRLGHKTVYLPGEGFLYHDPKVNAFAHTSDQKVEIMLSNYLIQCAESMRSDVDSKPLVKDHRRPQVLTGIVNRAKIMLEADPRFFEGPTAPNRYLNGRRIDPSIPSSPEVFIHGAFVLKKGESVSANDAYQEFLRYCQIGNLTRVDIKEFKRVAKNLILEKFQLGFRHDIRTPEGHQTHGWKHLCLVPDFAAQACEVAA